MRCLFLSNGASLVFTYLDATDAAACHTLAGCALVLPLPLSVCLAISLPEFPGSFLVQLSEDEGTDSLACLLSLLSLIASSAAVLASDFPTSHEGARQTDRQIDG